MMEWWNIGILGMESGKGHFLQKMLCLHFLMVPIRQLFFYFVTHNTASEQENQCKHMHFEFRFLETHHSNWGEAPQFILFRAH